MRIFSARIEFARRWAALGPNCSGENLTMYMGERQRGEGGSDGVGEGRNRVSGVAAKDHHKQCCSVLFQARATNSP